MPKMANFDEFLKTWSLRSNSVTRQVNFNRTKNGGNAKTEKLKCDILGDFQTLWKGCHGLCLISQLWKSPYNGCQKSATILFCANEKLTKKPQKTYLKMLVIFSISLLEDLVENKIAKCLKSWEKVSFNKRATFTIWVDKSLLKMPTVTPVTNSRMRITSSRELYRI